MKDENKTKTQLIKELKELRQSSIRNESQETPILPKDSPQFLDMITKNVSDLIAILDTDGKRLYNSDSYEKILGDPKKLRGTDSFKEIHPDDREKIIKIFQETVKSGIGQRGEYRFIAEDGSTRYIESQGNVIKDTKGKVKNVIVISRDVTEREEFELALHDSEERLKSILKSIPDIIYRLDPQGRITFISDAIQRYGYKSSQLLGMNMLDLVHPSDKEKANYRINERRTGDRRTKSFELRFLTTQGKAVYFEDRLESIQMEPVFLLEAEGLYDTEHPLEKSFMGTQGIARDITEHKKTEDENVMLAQALKCISECVSVTDLYNNIIFINDAFLKTYGFERHELIGKSISVVRGGKTSKAELKVIYSKTLAGSFKGEIQNIKKDGTEFPIHLSSSVINDQNGIPIALIGVATDISDRKRLETQLQQSQKLEAIGKLAGGVAHDFNNLLTVIQGYSELVLSNIHIKDPIVEKIKQISEAASRAESLTKQLLAFSRKQIMQPKVIDLNSLINDMQDMLQRLIGADIEFVIQLSENLGQIKADPGQVEQVIMNLVVNARDAMQQGGQLMIDTENVIINERFIHLYPGAQKGDYVHLKIRDTGLGMDKETQAHIFEPFFTTKEEGAGTGLGLSTVYGIIKQSGGYIYVSSERKKGTTFNLLFPRVHEPLDSEEKSIIPDSQLAGEETVLVVEDQHEVRQLIIETLKMYGYNVLDSPNGGKALVLCQRYKSKIDLIISDIVMPQMSGKELIDKLLLSHPNMKVVFISGYSENSFSKKNSLDLGMIFIQKPFTPLDLLRKIRQLLDSELQVK